MKMQFHHAGRQFFFITIAIERHPKANPAPQGFGGGKPPSLPRRQPPRRGTFRGSLMSARARRCCPAARL